MFGQDGVELGLVVEEPHAGRVPEAELDLFAGRDLLERIGEILEIAPTDAHEVLAAHHFDRPLRQVQRTACGRGDPDAAPSPSNMGT